MIDLYIYHRFEKLDITPKSAQKIKPVLERWMAEAEERYKNGVQNLTDFIGSEPSKKRKRRTSFTPQALELLNQYFERNTHPTGILCSEVVVFFCGQCSKRLCFVFSFCYNIQSSCSFVFSQDTIYIGHSLYWTQSILIQKKFLKV